MKKTMVTSILLLSLLTPVSANAETPEERTAKIQANIKAASNMAKIAKAKSEYALIKAKQAEAISKKTTADVEVLRIKTNSQLQGIKKQLDDLNKQVDALIKLLKTSNNF